MSYILEALKQSEKARQKGQVPDIYTAPATIRSSIEAPSRRVLPYLLLATALVALAAVFLWWNPWQAAEQTRITTAAPSATAEETAATAPEPAPAADQPLQPEVPSAPLAEPEPITSPAVPAASGAAASTRPAARVAGGGNHAFRRLTLPVTGLGRRQKPIAMLY